MTAPGGPAATSDRSDKQKQAGIKNPLLIVNEVEFEDIYLLRLHIQTLLTETEAL